MYSVQEREGKDRIGVTRRDNERTQLQVHVVLQTSRFTVFCVHLVTDLR